MDPARKLPGTQAQRRVAALSVARRPARRHGRATSFPGAAMFQPSMLILLAPRGDDGADALARLRDAGHLALPAGGLDAALASGGPLAPLARHLASQCDALVAEGAPPAALARLFRALRRPVYPAIDLVPRAQPPTGNAPLVSTATLLGLASRVLDR